MKKNNLPDIIDLFSGCGGLAMGFHQEGFRIVRGIELMENAVRNANYNLSIKYGDKPVHICGDITQIDAKSFIDDVGPDGCIVIGGPPCQAYSMIGRSKINSVRSKGCYLDDKRGFLYEDFLRFAIDLNAKAVVMENVRASVDWGGRNIPEKVSAILEKNGYTVYWTILNSADFGVPQVRERMILFAVKGSLKKKLLPVPTNSGKVFGGLYSGFGIDELTRYQHFMKPNKPERRTPKWVTVEEAIGDLPSLQLYATDSYKAYPLNLELPYADEPSCSYQREMRGNRETVNANAYRNTPRDFPIFARMVEGDNFVQAAKIADEILQEKCSHFNVRPNSPEYEILKQETVPPYSTEKFLSKWKKLDRSKPSHTLVAHLCMDTYSHIHPWEPRGISVREAARIQSFSDDYVFQGNMGDAYKQIGNSVPPKMAKAIAHTLKEMLLQEE